VTPPTLHADRTGRGPRLVMVHGFTQNRRCWGPVAGRLSEDHELVLIDAPGHGRSGHVVAPFEEAALHIGHTGGRAAYLGYSMGGRLCLQLAVSRPDLVQALILVGATAGIDDPVERQRRREADHRLADHLEAVGLSAFLDEWLDNPLFRSLPTEAAHREQRLDNTAHGLASSLRSAGTGSQPSLWDRLGDLDMPVLAVAGADDTRYAELAGRITSSVSGPAEVVLLEGSGHAAHLEQPEVFVGTVRAFLQRHGER
jgi:2-succinyl-6-hydroxy-2,4-cyclohexadiene-1-carboxylate synthase